MLIRILLTNFEFYPRLELENWSILRELYHYGLIVELLLLVTVHLIGFIYLNNFEQTTLLSIYLHPMTWLKPIGHNDYIEYLILDPKNFKIFYFSLIQQDDY